MIIDTSAVIAVLRDEADADQYVDALGAAARSRMSAATYVETAVVVDANRDPVLSRRFDDFMVAARIAVEAVTAEQAEVARRAYRDFGRGSGHPARLNFGECFSYALARVTAEPLLFKRSDFWHTDIESALTPGATS